MMLTLFGAAPDTGNQGVTALCHATVEGLWKRGLGSLVVADHGRGLRGDTWTIGGNRIRVQKVGATHTRRIYRSDSLLTIRFCVGVGGLGNPCAEVLKSSRAVLDVSGGDSFTDLYGRRRFEAISLYKCMALAAGRPLILLPQTIGPFNDPVCRRSAAALLRQATAIWTRDRASFSMLRDLLGDDFDPARHHQGVDMALLLAPRMPQKPLPTRIWKWLVKPALERKGPVVGLNVSGLLYNSADGGRAQFKLVESYRDSVHRIATSILAADPRTRLLLIPHVLVAPDNPESDWAACRSLRQSLDIDAQQRTAVLPPDYGASELKSIFAKLDWFCGTRMHATIGAFSQGVPTLALAYSDKTEGVFETCGLASSVVDLRSLGAAQLGEAALLSLGQRDQARAFLHGSLPGIIAGAEAQMDEIAECIQSLSSSEAAA